MSFTVYVERLNDGSTFDWEGGLQPLFDDPEIEVSYPESEGPELQPADLAGADAYVSRMFEITGNSIEEHQDLKIITRAGAGYDNLDLDALTSHGIVASHAPQGPTESVAQATLCLLIACAHNMKEFEHRFNHQGFTTGQNADMGFNLRGRTLGVIGCGSIGQRVIELVEPFEMDVLVHDPYAEEELVRELGAELVGRERVLRESNLVTIHVPLTESTHHMLGESDFRMMQDSAWFVNTSRGGLYPDEELARAVREGWIRGVAIDVFENEPDVENNPLLDLDHCITLPHMTGRTIDTMRKTGSIMAESIRNVKDGEYPLNVLNPEVYDESVPEDHLSPVF